MVNRKLPRFSTVSFGENTPETPDLAIAKVRIICKVKTTVVGGTMHGVVATEDTTHMLIVFCARLQYANSNYWVGTGQGPPKNLQNMGEWMGDLR